MFEDIQLIYMNVKILKFWSLLYDQNWRRYVCLTPATFLVFTQFYYMFMTHEGIDAIIRNSYMLVLWFNTIIRAYILIYDREKYEHLIGVLEKHFYDLMVRDFSNRQYNSFNRFDRFFFLSFHIDISSLVMILTLIIY